YWSIFFRRPGGCGTIARPIGVTYAPSCRLLVRTTPRATTPTLIFAIWWHRPTRRARRGGNPSTPLLQLPASGTRPGRTETVRPGEPGMPSAQLIDAAVTAGPR